MRSITHSEQQEAWEQEHKTPTVLLQMDQEEASSGVQIFHTWITENTKLTSPKALEIGCGKGRNCIWLAQQGIEATGFDFSQTAIEKARHRALLAHADKASFVLQDATIPWKFEDNSFDLGIDCFAFTDIESEENRNFAAKEFYRVLKVGGYLLVYALSTDDEFHKEMIKKHPSTEKNALVHPTGKFEKVFDAEEIITLHNKLHLVVHKRLAKTPTYEGKKYNANHHWMIFEKKS